MNPLQPAFPQINMMLGNSPQQMQPQTNWMGDSNPVYAGSGGLQNENTSYLSRDYWKKYYKKEEIRLLKERIKLERKETLEAQMKSDIIQNSMMFYRGF
jgi:hypothetical protein